jgi:CpeT protein
MADTTRVTGATEVPVWRCTMLTLLAACAGGEGADTDGPVTDEAVEARLARYLTGTFDSVDQAAEDADYLAVRMVLCPVEAPELGERVLYLEQAQVSTPDQPYRQRLYVIEAGDAPDQAVSRIYGFPRPEAAVGGCEDPGRLPDGGGAIEREGCAVTLAWDGERFEGGTTGTACPTSLGGDYTTSEVTLDEGQLTSWDRGFHADGSQAWGVTGGPYVFVRRSDLPPR